MDIFFKTFCSLTFRTLAMRLIWCRYILDGKPGEFHKADQQSSYYSWSEGVCRDSWFGLKKNLGQLWGKAK